MIDLWELSFEIQCNFSETDMSIIFLPKDIENMSSIECFETALKDSNIITIDDVDDESKISKVDISLFAAGLIKSMEENENGQYLFHRAYLYCRLPEFTVSHSIMHLAGALQSGFVLKI